MKKRYLLALTFTCVSSVILASDPNSSLSRKEQRKLAAATKHQAELRNQEEVNELIKKAQKTNSHSEANTILSKVSGNPRKAAHK